MNYNDEKMLSVEGYENMAKAYSNLLKQQGFMIVKVDNEENKQLMDETLELITTIKAYLFRLGGFLNTGKLYSLTDRQSKKLEVIFDSKLPIVNHIQCFDKTKCFLNYLSYEFALLKNLIALKDQSNFESNILRIIDDRLVLLHKILKN